MKKIKVGIMNSSHEVTSMISAVFEDAGFDTCDIFTYQMKYGEIRFSDFVNEQKPDVILYDIAIPYEENYRLFLAIAKNMVARKIPFVLTTTNKDALEQIVGDTGAFEIIGKPYDLDELVSMIKKSLQNRNVVT